MYHYKESGLRNIWLANGYDRQSTPYGPGTSIHNVEELHRAIGRALIAKGGKLTGSEFRFVRQELGMSQAKLALFFGNSEQAVALWEKQSSVPKWADRFLRALYREDTEGNAGIREIIERLADSDIDDGDDRINFEERGGAWKVAA
jgi:DNA-binding transcriptional regulator YiaG